MSKLNIFVDGSWLFRSCAPELVLSSKTEDSKRRFPLSFEKLNQAILKHVQSIDGNCDAIGDCYISTSIFEISPDINDWPDHDDDVDMTHIERIKRAVTSRNYFISNAQRAGYKNDGVFRPELKLYMLKNWIKNRYQEKQVDTTVVALLVRAAIIQSRDYHVIITGDSDVLPAIKVAYPEYTANILVATSHPDELNAQCRQTSFSLNNFEFKIEPFYFQDHISDIIHGQNVYHCANCHKVFVREKSVPTRARPYCSCCIALRT